MRQRWLQRNLPREYHLLLECHLRTCTGPPLTLAPIPSSLLHQQLAQGQVRVIGRIQYSICLLSQDDLLQTPLVSLLRSTGSCQGDLNQLLSKPNNLRMRYSRSSQDHLPLAERRLLEPSVLLLPRGPGVRQRQDGNLGCHCLHPLPDLHRRQDHRV